MSDDRKVGTVRSFNATKGFGFIEQENGDNVFVHQTAIISNGPKTLQDGQAVSFTLKQGKNGYQAVNVEVIETDTP